MRRESCACAHAGRRPVDVFDIIRERGDVEAASARSPWRTLHSQVSAVETGEVSAEELAP